MLNSKGLRRMQIKGNKLQQLILHVYSPLAWWNFVEEYHKRLCKLCHSWLYSYIIYDHNFLAPIHSIFNPLNVTSNLFYVSINERFGCLLMRRNSVIATRGSHQSNLILLWTITLLYITCFAGIVRRIHALMNPAKGLIANVTRDF